MWTLRRSLVLAPRIGGKKKRYVQGVISSPRILREGGPSFAHQVNCRQERCQVHFHEAHRLHYNGWPEGKQVRNQGCQLVNLGIKSSELQQRFIGRGQGHRAQARSRARDRRRPAKQEAYCQEEAGFSRGGMFAPGCSQAFPHGMTVSTRGRAMPATECSRLRLDGSSSVGRWFHSLSTGKGMQMPLIMMPVQAPMAPVASSSSSDSSSSSSSQENKQPSLQKIEPYVLTCLETQTRRTTVCSCCSRR